MVKRMRVCSRCLKAGKVQRPPARPSQIKAAAEKEARRLAEEAAAAEAARLAAEAAEAEALAEAEEEMPEGEAPDATLRSSDASLRSTRTPAAPATEPASGEAAEPPAEDKEK